MIRAPKRLIKQAVMGFMNDFIIDRQGETDTNSISVSQRMKEADTSALYVITCLISEFVPWMTS